MSVIKMIVCYSQFPGRGGMQCLGEAHSILGGHMGSVGVEQEAERWARALPVVLVGRNSLGRAGGQPWDGLVEITSGDSQAS